MGVLLKQVEGLDGGADPASGRSELMLVGEDCYRGLARCAVGTPGDFVEVGYPLEEKYPFLW